MLEKIRKATDKEIGQFGRGQRVEFPIPTEMVITESKICTPRQGRAYFTGLFFLRGKIVDYTTIKNEPDFKGSCYFPSVYMIEAYEDWGDDGHTDMSLMGFVMCAVGRRSDIVFISFGED